MANRPVHWSEGMFLRPHHFQAADRFARHALMTSEDRYQPFPWGLRAIDLDGDALRHGAVVLHAAEARFKDGTKLTIPGDATVETLALKTALAAAASATVYLAVPRLQPGRADVEESPTAHGPRYSVEDRDVDDENTGGQDQPIQFRRTRARLLLADDDHTGYEVLPLVRVARSAQAEAPPQIDATYVPPLLVIDAWPPPLWQAVQQVYHQIAARVDLLADQVADRRISFESQVPGDAERLLKLAVLNAALAASAATAFVPGLTPLAIYRDLCRLVGELALFAEATRRPPPLPTYDHDDLGGGFSTVLRYLRRALEGMVPAAFEKRYFERNGDRLQVSLEPAWLSRDKTLFLGVETDLGDDQCEHLLRSMDMKLGSTARVEQVFKQALRGLKLVPVVRPPRALPAGTGVVYYQIERDPVFWRDVAETASMAIRMNLAKATFQGDRVLAVVPPQGGAATNLQFALFIT